MGCVTQLASRTSPRDVELPRPLEVRPYEPDDADLLGSLSERLSRQSLYTRFFAGTPRLPTMYIRALDQVDHWNREALIALAAGEIIGIAEYVRDAANPLRADLAVLVADAWQRRGVARLLVAALTTLAAQRNITDLNADVLAINKPALTAIQRLWPGALPRGQGDTATFTLPTRIPHRDSAKSPT
jgi:GNAT superfamily N-acetyltransferase